MNGGEQVGEDSGLGIPDAASAVSWASSPAVRKVMQANRRRDTEPELLIRRMLHASGLRYRVDYSLPFDRRRKADIVFTRAKVAVMIDGCFWHRCPEHYVPPKSNVDYWEAKTLGNAARDRDTDDRLRELGWTVLRFWEHEDPEVVAHQIRERLPAAHSRIPGAAANR